MIANPNELEIAFDNLQRVESALKALAKELQVTNATLLPVVAQTYARRICALQEDIVAYCREHATKTPELQNRLDHILAHRNGNAVSTGISFKADGTDSPLCK